jgi:putative ABC transport system permease protein
MDAMFDIAFKNILRQRTRTILTTLGILIGIGAIVSLGSVAEGLDIAIQSGLELTAGKITVMEADTGVFGMGGEFDQTDIDVIMGVSGVKEVVPIIYHADNIGFTGPSWVAVGVEADKLDYLLGENIKYEEGRAFDPGESDVAVIGYTISQSYNVHEGDTWTIKDKDFEIVGVTEETGISDIDTSIAVPFEDLQNALNTDTFQYMYVIPDDVKDTERVAQEIEDTNDKYSALTSQELARQTGEIVDQIRIFTFGIGAIAAFVGGLGVMNTMIMSVMERRREIGVMKAIGATNTMVLQQIITESAMISLLGGIGGVLIGMVGALLLSNVIGGGQITATVTPGLAATGIGFALFLGVVGGLYPARKAASVDPVEALRYE